MRVLLAVLLAKALVGQDLTGVMKYVRAGVQQGSRTTPWSRVASIEERDPDPAAEYAARKAMDTAGAQFELGRWCRERGLDAADKHLARALELDGKHEGALVALGRAADLVESKRRSVGPMAFADWCRDHALPDLQWETIVAALVKNGQDGEAIRRMKEVMDRRCASTVLRAPFTGRWLAIVDATRHHQKMCHAVYSFDFSMVDGNGRVCRGKGRDLADYYGYDQPVLAAADGEVQLAVDGFDDNPIDDVANIREANMVEIKHADRQFTTYAHFKKGSVAVKVGQKVKCGEVIGRVGNSGMSTRPHLHFAMNLTVFSGRQGITICQPFRFGGCRLVAASVIECSVDLRAARPQEGWILDCPPLR